MRAHRGFTMIELVVTVVIFGILAALAYPLIEHQRPRANLAGTATELFAVIRNARQSALATGRNTVVMVFPQVANSLKGTGRVVVVEDPNGTMFGATAPNFASFDPTAQLSSDNLLGDLSFPIPVTVGLGGAAAPALRPPYSSLPSGACTFCGGTDGRGAIVFDYRGRARFYSDVGNPQAVFGGTIALQAMPDVPGFTMLVVNAATGSAFTLNGR